jgi:hypothetical protein
LKFGLLTNSWLDYWNILICFSSHKMVTIQNFYVLQITQ